MNRSILIALAALALGGCGDDDAMMPTPDAGGDAGPAPTCADYCAAITTNCTGANQQYADMGTCMSFCETNGGWDVGTLADTSGNTVGCRLYHAGAPAMTDPVAHCVHAGPSGGDTCGNWCDNYCQLALDNCTEGNQIYADMATCAAACEMIADDGVAGATGGDSIQCRIYHLGVAGTDAASAMTHCPHGAADGGGPMFCGSATPMGFDFRTDAAAMYTNVDRMGMPAVSTALISAAMKNAYNDASPADDAAGTFVPELTANLQGLHTALRDDLVIDNMLVPCGGAIDPPDVSQCIAQAAPLVVPDTLKLNTATASGFPNGRLFSDPVIDVTLAVILLDLRPATGQTATSLVGVLNPDENEQPLPDRTMPGMFPWLNAPYE